MRRLAAALIVAVGGAVLAWPATRAPAQDTGTHDMAAMGGNAEANAAYKAAMDKMMQGMMAPATGDPDRDFATGMTAHHQGAIDMAEVELRYGKDPELRGLAEEIVAAQKKEIVLMQAWLAKHPM